MNKLKLWLAKYRARKYYNKYIYLLDYYNCGSRLTDEITSGELSKYRNLVNKNITIINKLDPDADLMMLG